MPQFLASYGPGKYFQTSHDSCGMVLTEPEAPLDIGEVGRGTGGGELVREGTELTWVKLQALRLPMWGGWSSYLLRQFKNRLFMNIKRFCSFSCYLLKNSSLLKLSNQEC